MTTKKEYFEAWGAHVAHLGAIGFKLSDAKDRKRLNAIMDELDALVQKAGEQLE
jgi:hypothetical protein